LRCCFAAFHFAIPPLSSCSFRAITFRSVLRVIKKHAFVASSFPVIISIESHLSEEMQRIAAENIKTELGNDLFVIPASDSDLLPSPEALKGKVLIKAKKGRWGLHATSLDERDDDVESSADDEESGGSTEATGSSGDLPAYCKDIAMVGTDASSTPRTVSLVGRTRGVLAKLKAALTGNDDGMKRKLSSRKRGSRAVARELAEVTSFSGCSRQKVLASWASGRSHPEGHPASDIVSLGELKILDSFSTGLWTLLREHNSRNLTRVYPKAARVDSGNYNPMPAWRAGCQLAALNWQTPNLGTWLNAGRFTVNGDCGYALKRPPIAPGGISGGGELEVCVLSGFLLPHHKSTMRGAGFADYYVEVSVVGCGQDGLPIIRSKSTPVVKDGFSPSWRETLTLAVDDAEFEMLLLRVYDKDRASRDGLLGFYCSPVYAIRTGIRACHLRGEDGTPLLVPGSSCLLPTVLCKVAWRPTATGGGHR
jgi:phosphatidylinositol phospholipase C, delta